MQFEIEWLSSDKSIIKVTLPQTYTWEDQNRAVRDICAEMATVKHTVHLIMDARGSAMPRGNPLPHLRYLVQSLPSNTGLFITVGAGTSERTILNAFMGVAQKLDAPKNQLVDTMDEAMTLIKRSEARSR